MKCSGETMQAGIQVVVARNAFSPSARTPQGTGVGQHDSEAMSHQGPRPGRGERAPAVLLPRPVPPGQGDANRLSDATACLQSRPTWISLGSTAGTGFGTHRGGPDAD